MSTPVALVMLLSLAPAQANELKLTNLRATYGPGGPTRPDAKFLPGDIASFSFDIENLKFDADGKAHYSIAKEVLDSKGDLLVRQDPRNAQILNILGGATIPARAQLDVRLDQPPDEYTLKVTVTDRLAKTSATLVRKAEVLPAGFGLVQVGYTDDADGDSHAPPLAVTGEVLYVNFSAVGFARDKTTKQPNLAAEVRVLDDKGKPTFPKPIASVIDKNVPEELKLVPLQFGLALNRAGKFTVQVKVADKITGKSYELSLPLTVIASP